MDWRNVVDSFGGGGGSQNQGAPTTAGAGDGAKGDAINSWLNRVTGVYQAFAGTRSNAVGATTPNVPPPKPNYALYAGIAAVAGLLLWFAFKKH